MCSTIHYSQQQLVQSMLQYFSQFSINSRMHWYSRNWTRYGGQRSTNDGIAYSMRQSSCYWRSHPCLSALGSRSCGLRNSKTLMEWLPFSVFAGMTLLSSKTGAFLLWWHGGMDACLPSPKRARSESVDDLVWAWWWYVQLHERVDPTAYVRYRGK